MNIYSIEVHGTITRDIKWYEVDAESVEQAREVAQKSLGPNYRINAVSLIDKKLES